MSPRLFIDVTDIVGAAVKTGAEDADTARAIVHALASLPDLHAMPVLRHDGHWQILHGDDLPRLIADAEDAAAETQAAATPPETEPPADEALPAPPGLRGRARSAVRRVVRTGIARLSPAMQEDVVEILHRLRHFGARPAPEPADATEHVALAPEPWAPRLGPLAFPSAGDVVWMSNPAIWRAGSLRAGLAMRADRPGVRRAFHVGNAPAARLAVLGVQDAGFAPVTAAVVDLLDTADFITAASEDIAASLASVASATRRRVPAIGVAQRIDATVRPTAQARPSVAVPVDLCSAAEIGLLSTLHAAMRGGADAPVFTISGHPLPEAMPALDALKAAEGNEASLAWVDEAKTAAIRHATVVLYLQQPGRVWKAAVRTLQSAGAVVARSRFTDHAAGMHAVSSDDPAAWMEALLAHRLPAATERDHRAAAPLMAGEAARALAAWLHSTAPRA